MEYMNINKYAINTLRENSVPELGLELQFCCSSYCNTHFLYISYFLSLVQLKIQNKFNFLITSKI